MTNRFFESITPKTTPILSLAAMVVASNILTTGIANAAPTNEELWKIIQEQEAEIEALKKEQGETSESLAITEERLNATADAIDQGGASGSLSKSLEWAEKTRIGGYTEHHFNNFQGSDNDEVDAHRFVLYVNHEFNNNVRLFTEFELEHSLAGDGAPGEVELEQAYIEWDFAQNHSLAAGLFLIPVGIINETHEPNTFYGVERNRVEGDIIPTTWWETGVMFSGDLAPGVSYNFAMHSGLNNENADIRSGRQKSAQATANDFAYTGRIKYTAIPGLELAATLQYQEDLNQSIGESLPAILTEFHAVYNTGKFGLRALWAQWDIDGDFSEGFINSDGNFTEDFIGRDQQNGWYIEPSYKILDNVGVFLRYSERNEFAGLNGREDLEVTDIGVNYWLTPGVVFKADYQDDQSSNNNDSFNLGVGWSF